MKKELRIIVPEELYKEFKKRCNSQYKSLSEVIRDFILEYTQRAKDE